jgi:hypothetical protein
MGEQLAPRARGWGGGGSGAGLMGRRLEGMAAGAGRGCCGSTLAFVFTLGAAPQPAAAQANATARCDLPFPPVQCMVPGAARRTAPVTLPRARSVTPARTFGKIATPPAPKPAPQRAAPAPPPRVAQSATQPAGAGSERLPASRDELFGDAPAPVPAPPAASQGTAEPPEPGSREALFGADEIKPEAPRPAAQLRGFVQFAPAYTYSSPGHWSRGVVRTQGEVSGRLSAGVKYKASVRLDLDPVYMGSDFYPSDVREDQRAELLVRETYLDFALPANWELRLGRQHIVWGEVVGLFFADVVSARDLRDFILPDFDILRIPQWAARGEYFGNDWHLELVWIPVPSYDTVGKPGAEFYPFVIPATPGLNQVVLDDDRPSTALDNTNYGARVSRLIGGWDLSAFYYRSTSATPTLHRELTLAPVPTMVFEPRHDRIWQGGGTLTKDLGSVVLKAEAIYTEGRRYELSDPARVPGVAQQDTFDYIVGLDFMLPRDGRLNLQGFQRVFFDHDSDIYFDEVESGVSLLVSAKLTPKIEPELLIIQSLNSHDRLLRPRVNLILRPDLIARFGIDIFDGPDFGLFGRFDDRDRVYGELRYSF